MDSCGLATLIEALQITRAQKTKFIVCNLSARVRSVFELSRLTTVLTVVDSHEQALLA
jgi:anti-anti-sigma factor